MSYRTLTFILACFLTSTAWCQNHLFVPFGQKKDEVRQYLESRDYTQRIISNGEMETLMAIISDEEQVEYVFEKDKLYAITYLQHYTDLKEAAMSKKNFLEYMKKTDAMEIGVTKEGDISCHTGLNPTRVLKLFVRQHPKGVTLVISSISRFHGPRIEKEDFFYEKELIQKKLAARSKN